MIFKKYLVPTLKKKSFKELSDIIIRTIYQEEEKTIKQNLLTEITDTPIEHKKSDNTEIQIQSKK